MRMPVNTKRAKGHSAQAITAILLVAFCVALLLASSAQAGDGFVARGSFTGPISTEFNPYGVAVDDATGDVLVSNEDRVLVYDSGGAAAAVLSEFGEGELSAARAIAVDQSSHAVYVLDAGSNRIDRYTRSGATPPTYTLDKAFKTPAQGGAAGEIGSFESSLAIDPTSGDLLVADQGNQRVSRYKPNGEFLSSFDGSDMPGGAFTSLQGITVDPSGNVYAVDGPFSAYYLTSSGAARVERFNPAGEAQAALGGGVLEEARFLAYDALRGDLVVLAGGGQEAPPFVVYTFHGDSLSAQFSDPEGGMYSGARGLAVDGGATGRLYTATTTVSIFGIRGVQVFDASTFPTLDPPSGITLHGAHFSGEITPGSVPSTAHFEYSTDQLHWTIGPKLPPLSAPGSVSENVTGLLAHQKYYVRLVSASDDVTTSLVETFTTPTGAPEVVTLPASEVSATRASLPGTINANGLLTSYHVEYGTSEAYGSAAPVGFEDIVGQLRVPSTVNVVVEGLEPGTTYHYRVVATNSAGTTYGPDQVLATDTTDGSLRGFEEVTPPVKGGAQLSDAVGFRVSADGSEITIGTLGLFDPLAAEAAPLNSTYFAERGEAGWNIRSLDVPFTAYTTRLRSIFGVSPDLTRLVTLSDEALTPGAVAGKTNIYLEDLRTGQLSLAAVFPHYLELAMSLSSFSPVQFFGDHDWSHLYATSPDSLTADEYEEVQDGVYELKDGISTLMTLHGAGGEAIGGVGNVSLSPDDRYFAYAGMGDEAKPGKGMFMRQGSEVTALSVSERPGDPSTPQGARTFEWAADGSAVIFQDDDPSGLPLTADAPEGVHNIYRYVLNAEAGHHLQYVGNGELFATAGETVLYKRGSEVQLFAWREGQTHVLSESLPFEEEERATLISPDGRYVEVVTSARLTPDAPTSVREVYLFDLDANDVRCVSCTGLADAGPASAGFLDSPAAPTDEGEVFFQTATGLVSSDSNGESDVYAYKAGRVHLISRGTPGTYALLAGASPSGHDVFLDTNDQLVAQDRDVAADIYDARIGGGIAAQNPDPRGECSGNACRGVTSTSPPPALLGSESLESTGNVSSSAASKPAVRSLTRAQKLSRALKACRIKREERKRASCEREARKRYGPVVKSKPVKNKGKRRTQKTARKSTNDKGSK